MISTDQFLDRTYHPRNYNCGHLVAEVWNQLTGTNIHHAIGSMLTGVKDRTVDITKRHYFRLVEDKTEPSIVLFRGNRIEPHCGVYLRRRVLHITPRGVEFQPLEVVGLLYPFKRFYSCRTV